LAFSKITTRMGISSGGGTDDSEKRICNELKDAKNLLKLGLPHDRVHDLLEGGALVD